MNLRKHIDNLKHIIQTELHTCGRAPDAVQLLAVSKNMSVTHMLDLYQLGITSFAENNLQTALRKQAQLIHYPIEWHFIGSIQRNKTLAIAQNFTWVHSVDRQLIAQRLSEQRPTHLPPLQICIQINLEQEHNKSGVTASEILPLANFILTLPNLKLRGLMCIPKPHTDIEEQYTVFSQLKTLQQTLNQLYNFKLDTLSMGMSNDFRAAIRAGSTIIRLGQILNSP